MWKVTDSKFIIVDQWLKLRADTCLTEAGDTIAPYYVLEEPPLATILPLTSNQEVIAIRQYRHAVGRDVLELPGGAVDATDASPAAAARRELAEETGYEVDQLVCLGTIDAHPVRQTNQIHCFLGTNAVLSGTPRLENSEQITIEKLSISEIISRAQSGELKNPHHMSCLFLAVASKLLSES